MNHPTLIKWPSRSRPALVQSMFHKWNVPGVEFLFTLDGDDPELARYTNMLDGLPNVTIRVGNSKGKVEAVNDGLVEHPWKGLCVLASDDMEPQTPEWHDRVCELFAKHFPQGDGVLHLNDGRTGKTLNTLCICDRKYFSRFNYLYHPAYVSVYPDNEWQEVSERLGRAVYVDEVLVRHRWVDATGRDELHKRNEALPLYQADEKTFHRRKAAGFPVSESLAIA
jgi:hypothetical protein